MQVKPLVMKLHLKPLPYVAVMFCLLQLTIANAQDSPNNCSVTSDACKSSEYFFDMFCIHGAPQNLNADDSIIVLVNHGYIVGFSPKRKQPVWVAYQVSKAAKATDYARPLFFVDDGRLPDSCRVGSETYGGGYDLGHMAPNASINVSYGKLSQMETFLMSNISPQTAGLNRGLWAKLEEDIRDKYCNDKERETTPEGKKITKIEHVWVIVGPIFGDTPTYIDRDNGTKVEIPEAFYCILARPFRYSYDVPSNSQYISFIFPQNLAQKQKLDTSFIVTINDIEARTGINFFPDFTKYYEGKIENYKSPELW